MESLSCAKAWLGLPGLIPFFLFVCLCLSFFLSFKYFICHCNVFRVERWTPCLLTIIKAWIHFQMANKWHFFQPQVSGVRSTSSTMIDSSLFVHLAEPEQLFLNACVHYISRYLYNFNELPLKCSPNDTFSCSHRQRASTIRLIYITYLKFPQLLHQRHDDA